MLIIFIVVYLLLTIIIGYVASRKVKTSSDFLVAGKKLPFYLATATVFATWFGSETLLGASSQFSEKGFLGIIEDPFGASLCLVLIGLFFAKPLYRMNLITFGDFYRVKFNRQVEIVASILLIVSYFGWIAGQMVALGVLFNVVAGIPVNYGIIIGTAVVVFYTFFGGMWSVSITDFFQMIVIIAGLVIVTIEITSKAQFSQVLEKIPAEHFQFSPTHNTISSWLNYFAMWMTIGLGSIAGQDVFQRVMASKSEKVAVSSSLFSSLLYISIAFLPIIIVAYGNFLYPGISASDSQLTIPLIVMKHSGLFVNVLFFGALISAIMSTASGAILAPSAILSENIIKPLFKDLSDKKFLMVSRLSVLFVSLVSVFFAFSKGNIYELVGQSSAISLVSLFIPLVAGLFLKGTSPVSALYSILFGISGWSFSTLADTSVNPLIFGLSASIIGLLVGMLQKKISKY